MKDLNNGNNCKGPSDQPSLFLSSQDQEMNIISFYLPQFYAFKENDEWWGKGFTEWTNVKRAKPLYKGHKQPVSPLNDNYYCLTDVETLLWQVNLAKKYGIHGFCFYHYWMGEGRKLMEKPVELFLENRELDLPFCLCWANHNWARTWTGGDTDILMEVKYGREEEWENHFQYLLSYFEDDRYIKDHNRPVFLIYQPELIPCCDEMLAYINARAIEYGFCDGICFISQNSSYFRSNKKSKCIEYSIEYEPNYAINQYNEHREKYLWKALQRDAGSFSRVLRSDAYLVMNKLFGKKTDRFQGSYYDYDTIWNVILNRKVTDLTRLPCGFVNFDASPRKGRRSVMMLGYSPDKFQIFLEKLILKTKNEYKKNLLFLTAWNEWGEGAYLEPDCYYGYKALEAVRDSMSKNSLISM